MRAYRYVRHAWGAHRHNLVYAPKYVFHFYGGGIFFSCLSFSFFSLYISLYTDRVQRPRDYRAITYIRGMCTARIHTHMHTHTHTYTRTRYIYRYLCVHITTRFFFISLFFSLSFFLYLSIYFHERIREHTAFAEKDKISQSCCISDFRLIHAWYVRATIIRHCDPRSAHNDAHLKITPRDI